MKTSSAMIPRGSKNSVEWFTDFITDYRPFGIIGVGTVSGVVNSSHEISNSNDGELGTLTGKMHAGWNNTTSAKNRACVALCPSLIANGGLLTRKFFGGAMRSMHIGCRVKGSLRNETTWLAVGCISSHATPNDIIGENGVMFAARGNSGSESGRIPTWVAQVSAGNANIWEMDTKVPISSYAVLEMDISTDHPNSLVRCEFAVNGKTVAIFSGENKPFVLGENYSSGNPIPTLEMRDKTGATPTSTVDSYWVADWFRVRISGESR